MLFLSGCVYLILTYILLIISLYIKTLDLKEGVLYFSFSVCVIGRFIQIRAYLCHVIKTLIPLEGLHDGETNSFFYPEISRLHLEELFVD